MLAWLQAADERLFFLVNSQWQTRVLDWVMPVITELKYFVVPIIVIWAIMVFFGNRRSRRAAFVILVLIAITDLSSSFILKPLFGRIRPCHVLDGVRLLTNCSSAYSMPSAHAVNMFAFATFFTLNYRKWWPLFFLAAAAVSYSRIYIGIHYPFDALAGAAYGSAVAVAVFFGERKLETRLLGDRAEQ